MLMDPSFPHLLDELALVGTRSRLVRPHGLGDVHFQRDHHPLVDIGGHERVADLLEKLIKLHTTRTHANHTSATHEK